MKYLSPRIIFLDIDGPMIPSGMFLINRMCSWERECSPICVALINRLCKEANAKIVTNSSHNHALSDHGGGLKEDLIKAGIKEEYFHENWRTQFPILDRLTAIRHWLRANGSPTLEFDWVAFDDSNFMEGRKDDPDFERLILVDFDHGLHLGHYNQVADLWNLKPVLIL